MITHPRSPFFFMPGPLATPPNELIFHGSPLWTMIIAFGGAHQGSARCGCSFALGGYPSKLCPSHYAEWNRG